MKSEGSHSGYQFKYMKVVARYFILIFGMTCLGLLSSGGRAEPRQNANQSPLKPGGSGRDTVRSLEKTIPRLIEEGDIPGLSIVLIRNARMSR
jgi:hypothetical protein